jgi:hypothetical protein
MAMSRDMSTLVHHPMAEKIIDNICQQTQKQNRHLFRVAVSYYLCKIASTMRVKVATGFRGTIPVNLYAINLAPSGEGKGHSVNIIEDQLLEPFRKIFVEQTLPLVAEENLAKLAVKRAYINNVDPDPELSRVTTEYKDLGELKFSYDSATTPALKQMRHKLIMAGIGAMNLEVDEIGINLLPNSDAFGSYLELFDIGKIKDKLTKNTRESIRGEELQGLTPCNLHAFGTPSKLLDGGKIEETFFGFNDMGFARRCIFNYMQTNCEITPLTAKQRYDIQSDPGLGKFIKDTALEFSKLANITNYNKIITLPKDVGIELLEYQLNCEKRAALMGEHGEYRDMAKAEMSHRYFKVLKLAGAYAFVDGHSEITMDNLYAAICVAEKSGESFTELINRDRPYAKLAKYIAGISEEVTHVDMAEDLPFYKGSVAVKNELMNNAIAWGHKNHIIIKRMMLDGIEFITGKTLTKTNINELIVSHSHDISDGYQNDKAPFNKLHALVLKKGWHWINHWSTNGHRDGKHMIPGFNMVILDVDEGAKVAEVCTLLKEYKFMLYTTKRHTATEHRFRVLMPLNYEMTMSGEEFRVFMKNIFEWLPFRTDEQSLARCKKWLSHPGTPYYSKGEKLLDARLFIPKTKKNNERKEEMKTYASLSNLERWFVQNSPDGTRNVQLHRYAMVLVDMGYSHTAVHEKILGLNSGLPDKMDETEINNTMMVSVAKKIGERDAKAA